MGVMDNDYNILCDNVVTALKGLYDTTKVKYKLTSKVNWMNGRRIEKTPIIQFNVDTSIDLPRYALLGISNVILELSKHIEVKIIVDGYSLSYSCIFEKEGIDVTS